MKSVQMAADELTCYTVRLRVHHPRSTEGERDRCLNTCTGHERGIERKGKTDRQTGTEAEEDGERQRERMRRTQST